MCAIEAFSQGLVSRSNQKKKEWHVPPHFI